MTSVSRLLPLATHLSYAKTFETQRLMCIRHSHFSKPAEMPGHTIRCCEWNLNKKIFKIVFVELRIKSKWLLINDVCNFKFFSFNPACQRQWTGQICFLKELQEILTLIASCRILLFGINFQVTAVGSWECETRISLTNICSQLEIMKIFIKNLTPQ